VAQKRYVPWNGHAKSWLANAQAMGYPVCWGSQCEPKAGAIVSLTGGNWLSRLYGHVAYVESVSNGWFTISEMNHAGWAVRSVRTISTGSGAIAGLIY
jgi:surface antigen